MRKAEFGLVVLLGDLKDNVSAFPLALDFDQVNVAVQDMPYDFLTWDEFSDLLRAAVKAVSHLLGGAFKKAFIPIYPNTLPTLPKPSRASRTASLVVNNLPASQSAITRLLNRCRG